MSSKPDSTASRSFANPSEGRRLLVSKKIGDGSDRVGKISSRYREEEGVRKLGMSDELTSPHLPAVGFISALDSEQRGILSSYGSFHFAEAGKTLIHQDESHGKLFFIISGLLHAIRREGDRELLLGTIHQGDWVGEVDLFDPSAAICSVAVIEKAQYWVMTRPDFEDFVNTHTEAGIQIMVGVSSTLARRLRNLTRKLVEEAEMASVRASLFGER